MSFNGLSEKLDDTVRLGIGDRQGQNAKLLLGFQRLEACGFFIHVGVHQTANAAGVKQLAANSDFGFLSFDNGPNLLAVSAMTFNCRSTWHNSTAIIDPGSASASASVSAPARQRYTCIESGDMYCHDAEIGQVCKI
jgi:hypothetical protein